MNGFKVVVLAAGALVCAGSGHAAVPLSVTQVGKFCEVQSQDYAIDRASTGSEVFEQLTSCALAVADADAHGQASAGFGPNLPQVGSASAEAQVDAYDARAQATLSASVLYQFAIQPIDVGAVPPNTPNRLPIVFTGSGAGRSDRSGYALARSSGVVHLYGAGLASTDAYFSFEAYVVDETAYDPVDSESDLAGFDETRHLNLYPIETYGVSMVAVCQTWVGTVGQDAAAWAGCTATISPTALAFDQTAFDQTMGAGTFFLADHYRFAYSANVPVPEPAPLALFVAGAAGLGLWRIRRQRRAAMS